MANYQLIQNVNSFESLIEYLRDELDWQFDGIEDVEDAFYEYEAADFGLDEKHSAKINSIRQIVPFVSNQPWGIFWIDFGKQKPSIVALRGLLRGLVKKKRESVNDSDRQRFALENLLFILTSESFNKFDFAYFRGEETNRATLSIFGWEKGETHLRTLSEHNLPKLHFPIDPRNAETWLKQWREAFDVEKVTQKFYERYEEIFREVEMEIGKFFPDPATKTLFTQRLFNRLMFLYFVQKKGWLKFNGNSNYLQSLFQKATEETENFYEERLQPLFFNGLNTPKNKRELWVNQTIGDVEFLNGGLFERDADGFDAVGRVEIPNLIFEKIFNLFAQYNFTVEESTPMDVQVAVDPEMLGKVFEELVTGRHDSGSYYTPRPIVSFMCRESLKHYLSSCDSAETIAIFVDEGNAEFLRDAEGVFDALKKIRVCDPACGSGAYILGMLQELMRLRTAIFASSNIDDKSAYRRKREIIETNLYGVDKDNFAVQVARLRLWLALAIESDVAYPLPNLDYKIGCGDSLLAPIDELQPNFERSRLKDEFRRAKDDFTEENDSVKKKELREKVEDLRRQIAESLNHAEKKAQNPNAIALAERQRELKAKELQRVIREGKKDVAVKWQKELNKLDEQLAAWKSESAGGRYDSKGIFDWTVEFLEVFDTPKKIDGGFDVVLANPPYVQLQKDGGKLAKLYEKNGFETFVRSGDVYSLFYEKGFELIKEKGVICYITSNKWMRANYGEKTRKFFAEKTNPLLIVDFGSVKIFQSATVDNNILILQKAEKDIGKGVMAVRTENDYDLSNSLTDYVQKNGYQLSSLTQNSWVIGEKDEFDIKSRVEKQGIPLEKKETWKIHINRGVVTGFNEAFVIPGYVKKQIEDISKQNGNDKSAELLKPMLRGKDIKAWVPEFADQWLISTFPTLSLNINNYPAIRDFLLGFGKERLEQSGEPGSRKKTSNDWYETQDQINYWRDFKKTKIIYPEITKYLPFVYDDDAEFYTNQKCFILTGESLKYLTCFFNSKLFKYCFSDNFPNLGEDRRELRKVFFEKIPVKQISADEEKPFNAFVDYIVFLKKRIQKSRSQSGEHKDELAMSLFFEQLSDALVLETYLSEDFQKIDISIRKHLPEFTLLNKDDEDSSLRTIQNLYQKIEKFTHPVRVNISAMKSIPAVQIIYNTVRF